MTDRKEVAIEDATEWVTEPPGEVELYLERDFLDDQDYQTVARDVTRAVLDANPRTATAINVLGLADALRDIDADAVELLSRETQLLVTEKQLAGKTDATPEIIDAVLSLYSFPLFTLSIYGADGTAIVARRDGTMLWCWLPESAYPELTHQLDETVLDALRFD